MLNGKVALVTGASRGIGRAIALELGRLGATVIVNYNGSEDKALAVVKELEAIGTAGEAYCCNVASFEDSEAMVAHVVEKFGSLDILVNNAGITKDTLMLRMSEEDFDRVIDTNLKGAFNCLKHATKVMVKQRSGKVINISSVVGVCGNAGQVNYSAAKAGIIGMTKSAAKELGGRNVTVNAIAPGYIDTDMTAVLSDGIKQSIIDTIPLKRMGNVDDIAKTVGFLCSNAASYITGQVISVDGGMNM